MAVVWLSKTWSKSRTAFKDESHSIRDGGEFVLLYLDLHLYMLHSLHVLSTWVLLVHVPAKAWG